jgi:hypothetical protein
MTDLYVQNLWNKVEYLHERYQKQHSHIMNFFEMIAKFRQACLTFSDSIQDILDNNYILAESKNSTMYEAMERFQRLLFKYKDSFKEVVGSIKINSKPIIDSLQDTVQKEKDLYNSYAKHHASYLSSKASLQKIYKEFYQKSKDCENKVYEAKKAKMYPKDLPEQINKMEQTASELLANTAIIEDKYIDIMNETNKLRETENLNQKKILTFYYNMDTNFYEKQKLMLGFFISCLQRKENILDISIGDLSIKYKNLNIEKDINDFVAKNKTSDKPDDVIKFQPYKVASEISDESILNADVTDKSKDNKILEVSYEVILLFKKFFKSCRTDLDMEKERKKSKLRLLTYKLFFPGDNVYLEDNEKRELYSLFRENNFRTYFLLILSRQRTKGYKKNPKLLKDFIEIFKYILDKAEKENNLDEAINCVILSQTYYCEQIGKNGEMAKKYILDDIRDNKWLSSFEFWEGIIDLMIKKEIEKNERINKNKNEIDKKNNNNNIYFSQIFSYTNNMIEFNINKNEILDFVEKVCKKYELEFDLVNAIQMNVITKIEEKYGITLKYEPKEQQEIVNENNEIKDEQNKKEEEKKEEEKKEEGKKEEEKKEEEKKEEEKKEEEKKE